MTALTPIRTAKADAFDLGPCSCIRIRQGGEEVVLTIPEEQFWQVEERVRQQYE